MYSLNYLKANIHIISTLPKIKDTATITEQFTAVNQSCCRVSTKVIEMVICRE